ncbi:MAG TPA: hypothetical protein VGZ02_13965 [Candidatus Baltobacteraceae bacterium]|jgi:photosystem II stability/assembly factor-like uncharacterized protein|nr:hypothetical protein [Candidatus Baltobacteraceae bacterium]
MLALLALTVAFAPAMTWRQLGPAAAGGRVAAVAGTDDDSRLYYLGSAGGGVFKTTDGGLRWSDVWTASSVGAIGAVAIAAHHRNVVWVGTGEAAPRNDASYGDGIWRTKDGGARWQFAGLPKSYAISRILIDPRNPDTVLAGALGNPFANSADRGVYRTTDGGRSWRRTLYAGPQSGISDMAADRTGRIAYAGVWQFRRLPWTFTSGGAADALYKSIDGGRTWRRLRGGGLPAGPMGRIGVAVAPSNPNRVYALIQSKAGLLWRSDDGGAHWRLLSRDTLVDQRPFYMSRLVVDPANENHVFFASENLIETRDGGRTLRDVHTAVHQDHHDFWMSRDGRRIIEADDGGAPISIDGGITWDWRFNVVLAQTYHAGYDNANPYMVCGAFQDDDSFCGPVNSLSPLGIETQDWRDVANDADGVWVLPEPNNSQFVWNVGVNELNGQLGIYDFATRQNYDITPSVTDTNGIALSGIPYRFNWEAPIAFGPDGAAYFGANVVFRTIDRGRTWTRISADLTRDDPSKQQLPGGPINTDVSGAEFYDTLLDIAPASKDPRVVWIGTDDGRVQRTLDGGLHWTDVTPAELRMKPWGRVECVELSNVSPGRAYAVVDRHLLGDREPYIFATDDGGANWRRIDAGLPRGEYAHVVREDPGAPGVLYAGLEQGVWMSSDGGAHWQSLRMNMPSVAIYDLRVQPLQRDLIAATHGRGLWVLDDLAPIEQLDAALRNPGPTLFSVRPAYAWYMWWTAQYGVRDDECCAPAGDYSASNPDYGAIVSYYLRSRVRAATIDVRDNAGRVIRTIAADTGAGLHRVTWDLGAEPPVAWRKARAWNRGPSSGPIVVPGRYTIALHAEGETLLQTVDVRPDPRAHWTAADYAARFQFLSELDSELSAVDAALNRLDEMRVGATAQARRSIDAVYGRLTSGVVNSEDNLWRADRLRERLTILQGAVALSQGPPLPPHLLEAQAIRLQYESAMAAYNAFLQQAEVHP